MFGFATPGYANIYYPQTVNRKLLPRSKFSHFVETESEKRVGRFYTTASNKVRRIRIADFHPVSESRLPAMQSLLDDVTQQQKPTKSTD